MFGRRRAGPRRVFEREGAGIADLVDERSVSREIRLGLAREADDEVGGEARGRAARRAAARSMREIVVARVPAVHGGEDAVRARLHRQMQVGHQLRQIAMRGDQIVVHVARMAGRVAQPRDAGDFGEATQQLAERPGRGRPARRRDRR